MIPTLTLRLLCNRHCSKGAIIKLHFISEKMEALCHATTKRRTSETRQFVSCVHTIMNLLRVPGASVASNTGNTSWSLLDILREGNVEEKGVAQSLPSIKKKITQCSI